MKIFPVKFMVFFLFLQINLKMDARLLIIFIIIRAHQNEFISTKH